MPACQWKLPGYYLFIKVRHLGWKINVKPAYSLEAFLARIEAFKLSNLVVPERAKI